MAYKFTPENSQNLVLFLVLILHLLFVIVILKSREKLKRRITVIASLTATCTAALAAMNSFLKYTPDGVHVLIHAVFGVMLLLSARLLIHEKIPPFLNLFVLLELNVFDRLQYTLTQTLMSLFERARDSLELNVFDRFQYRVAQALRCLARTIKGVQTGDLGLNMVGLVIGFILCLLLPLLLIFACS